MKKLAVIIMMLVLLAGCTYSSTLHVKGYNTQPVRVKQVPVDVAISIPDPAKVTIFNFGNTQMFTPEGQYLKEMSRRFIGQAFESVELVSGSAYSQNIDAVFIPKISNVKFQYIPVALGFGAKYRVDAELKGTLQTRDGLIVWEGLTRGSTESRSVVSPVLPVEDMISEALSESLAKAFNAMSEEIEMSSEVKRFADGLSRKAPVAVAAAPAYTAPSYTAPVQKAPSDKGYIGISVQDYKTDPSVSRASRFKNVMALSGALVTNIEKGSGAESAGIMVGDIITAANGRPVAKAQDLVDVVNTLKVNDYVDITGFRQLTGKYSKYVRLSPKPAEVAQAAPQAVPAASLAKPVKDASLPEYRKDVHAIVIGIDYNGRKDIPSLKYASTDARKVYNVLTDQRYGGVDPANATMLLNEEATRSRIISALRKLRTSTGYVYVYFSGHGAPVTEGSEYKDAVIIPYDAVISDTASMEETSVRLSYIQDVVDGSKAEGIMLAMDACFTGGGKSIVAKGGKPLVGMLVKKDLIKTSGRGKVILTSSAGNQQSWEDDSELKGGIFSHYLIEGLKGAASGGVWIKVGDLSSYLKDTVAKAAMRLKGEEQVPQTIGTGNFDITRNWEKFVVMDTDIGKDKLKKAFEQGYINASQLSRGVNELNSENRSRLLESFLDGKLDAKSFGQLY